MKKKVLIIIFSIIAIIILLWIIGIIPKIIGINTAKRYVNENYIEMNLKYDAIEFSSAYDDYIVRFIDENNNIYNFKLSSKYLPISVSYDSIIQSNVADILDDNNDSQSFYAKIKEIDKNYILVEGYYDNYRGEYDFTVKETTKILSKEKEIRVSDLKVGDYIQITFNGYVLERYPAGITNVILIQVLNSMEDE